jgi:hypothetical protein
VSATGAAAVGAGDVAGGDVAGGDVAGGDVAGGADAVAAVALAGDTPTPLPQPARSSPVTTRIDSGNSVLEGLIVGMPRLKYGHLVRAICRSLRT